MDVTKVIDAFGNVVYAALALLAVWGVYNAIMLYRGLAKKSIRGTAEPLLHQVLPPGLSPLLPPRCTIFAAQIDVYSEGMIFPAGFGGRERLPDHTQYGA